jgi:hypothetical protein
VTTSLSQAVVIAGQSASPQESARPPYEVQRSDEDWSVLRGRVHRGDRWDRLKFIPLSDDGRWYVTLGGEFRPFYELYDNYDWGSGPEDGSGHYLQRFMVHGDVRMGQRSRIFVELKSGIETGRIGGPRAPDEDRLDLNQAFVDFRSGPAHGTGVTLRLGRHEMEYGDGSLVSYREGPNVRHGYDGPKVILRLPAWRVDAFLVRPVETDPGVFDDGSDEGQTFWGLYAAAAEPALGIFGRPEIYYLGLRRANASYTQGDGRETRHTIGARAKAVHGAFEYVLEGTLQRGRFGRGSIRAWKHVQGVSYAFARARLRPRLGVTLAVSSGDEDPSDPDLQTFHPLFPRGAYYGHSDSSGSLNAIMLRPGAGLQLSKALALQSEILIVGRHRRTDGLYSQAGALLRAGVASDARYVGTLAQTELTWRVDSHTTATFQAGRHYAGRFLREAPAAANLTYVSAKVSYKF